MGEDFRIVRLSDPESFKQLELLQSEVWGRGDVIPYHVLIAFQEMGGLVLAAVDRYSRPIGMICGYNSFKNGKVFHYMHLCGVVPELRGHGIGMKMKIALRKYLLEQGIEHAAWLVDPLQIPEAYLSIHKLGAVGREYKRNFYGLMRDPYNRGLESDRLLVEWNLRSRRVEKRVSGAGSEKTVEVLENEEAAKIITTIPEGSFIKILDYRMNLDMERLLLEIPADIDLIKKRDLSTAVEWREVTRKLFEHYLSKRYSITDMIRGEGQRYYYLLEKGVEDGY